MERLLPSQFNDSDLVVRWPKTIMALFITGLFTLIFAVLIPFLVNMLIHESYPPDMSRGRLILAIGVISVFALIVFLAFISSFKNYLNPFLQFVATHEGIFFNILLFKKEVFFVPWHDIGIIEKSQARRSTQSGGGIMVDTIAFSLKPGLNYTFPKVMKSVEGCTKEKIQFAKDTINDDINTLIEKLNQMKSQ